MWCRCPKRGMIFKRRVFYFFVAFIFMGVLTLNLYLKSEELDTHAHFNHKKILKGKRKLYNTKHRPEAWNTKERHKEKRTIKGLSNRKNDRPEYEYYYSYNYLKDDSETVYDSVSKSKFEYHYVYETFKVYDSGKENGQTEQKIQREKKTDGREYESIDRDDWAYDDNGNIRTENATKNVSRYMSKKDYHNTNVSYPLKRNDIAHIFTNVNGTELYTVSSYLDMRKNQSIIRIIAIAPEIAQLQKYWCKIDTYDDLIYAELTVRPGVHEICKWRHANILCKVPIGVKLPTKVAVVTSGIPHLMDMPWQPLTWRGKPKVTKENKLALCLNTLFNLDKDYAPRFIEHMEMQKRLGMTHVFIYDFHDCSDEIRKIVKHYEDTGFVTVVPWKFPRALQVIYPRYPDRRFMRKCRTQKTPDDCPCVSFFSQPSIYDDCLYRSMDRFQYIVVHDLDEFIIPKKKQTLAELATEVQQTMKTEKPFASMAICEAKFCPNHGTPYGNMVTNTYYRIPAVIPKVQWWEKHQKTIIITDLTTDMNVHHIRQGELINDTIKEVFVERRFAECHHYKSHNECKNAQSLIEDNSISKFQSGLEQTVYEILKKIDL